MKAKNKHPKFLLWNGATPTNLSIPEGMKAYNMAEAEDSVEITMYDEVVENRPVDFWSGEPMPGLFIVLSEFLADLDKMKEKDHITVRINSVGGSLYAGIVIYNRLKQLKGKVTTIADGLAASAASMILQAGSTRQVFAGSQVMVHGASSFLFGSYNVQDLNDAINTINAGNKSAIETYAEATGLEKDKIKVLMDKTTWMTGQEVIDNGFADELIGGNVNMSITSDKRVMLVNGVPLSVKGLPNLPQGIPIAENKFTPGTNPDVIDQNTKQGGKKTMDLEQLRAQFPELVARIENDAKATAENTSAQAITNAAEDERNRIKAIEEIENVVGDTELIKEAKYGEEICTAEQLAFRAMQKQAQIGQGFLSDLSKEAKESGAEEVSGVPTGSGNPEEQEANDIANAAAVIAGSFVPKNSQEGK